MVFTRNDVKVTMRVNFVDEPIFIVNAPRPAVFMFQLFGFTDTFVDTVALNVLN